MGSPKKHILAFVAGFFATLVFHQGLVALLNLAGLIPMGAFNMTPTKPLGVPSVISLAFFGGLWGILLWFLVSKDAKTKQMVKAILIGAVGPTAVAFLVVFPLKGVSLPMAFVAIALLLNGAWGFGTCLFMRLLNRA